MIKRFIIFSIVIIILIIGAIKILDSKNDVYYENRISDTNSNKEDEVDLNNNIKEENATTENEIVENIEKNNDNRSEKHNTNLKNISKEKISESKNNTKNDNIKDDVITKNQKHYVSSQKQDNQSQLQKAEEKEKTQMNNKEEETKVDNKKEKYTYNESETNRIAITIDKYAKQNKELWGKNGEKKYSIKVTSTAMKNDFFYPFREWIVESKVKNVFSCTFQIYAVDIDNKTRYYIGIEEF